MTTTMETATTTIDRTSTWAGIGYNVQGAANIETVIRTSGLDYDVEKRPLYMPIDEMSSTGTIEIPNRFVTVRTSDNHPYDVVSDKFEIVQNRDAFDFVNYMGNEIQFERAGETASGMVYIIAKLPEVKILDDSFVPHVLFRNGFNGKVKITAAICPLRIVCQNQFNVAFKNTTNTLTIRHVQNADAKLVEARETLKMSAEYMQELTRLAERFAMIKMSGDSVQKLLDRMFPIPDESQAINSFKKHQLVTAREKFLQAYDADDNGNFRGTAWGLVNAYTDFITHKTPGGTNPNKEENRFINTTFGTTDSANTIIDVIQAIVAA